MNTRHIAFIAYQTMTAHKRVVDPKTKYPFWYDATPEDQTEFQAMIDRMAAGKVPAAAARDWNSKLGQDSIKLISAVVETLLPL